MADQLIYPPGRKPGLKKDKPSRIMDRCNSVRSAPGFEIIPEEYWEKACLSEWHNKNRENRFRYTLDQDGKGSCAAESATGIKAALDAKQGLPEVLYNPWSVYWYTSGGFDRGSVIGDNVEYLRDKGVCPEEVWPRSKGWRAEPSEEAKKIALQMRIVEFFYVENISELISALLQGFDVHGGYSGHAIAFCRYLGNGNLRYKNSWGESWGENGFGNLSVSKVYFPYGAYAYKNVHPFEWRPQINQRQLATLVNKYMVSGSRASYEKIVCQHCTLRT